MANRTAEIMELNSEFTVILWKGTSEVLRHNHLPKRSDAKWHADRWINQGRYIIGLKDDFKPKVCADKKCGRVFIPKRKHGEYCSPKCGDRVRHERFYGKKIGKKG